MTEKPPYRVPLMSEIARVEPNGFRAISLFAGAGGSSLGYRMVGFKMLWASEFIDAARADYEANAAPGTIVDGRDIREVDPRAVMRLLGLRPGELDVLDGSPPCSSFSMAGKREKGWNEIKKYSDKAQRTDDLFFEYVRFVDAFRPKVFVAENVAGLVRGTAKGYFLEILRALKAAGGGYKVEARLLDAQWLGVPQQRERIIFVGVRDDLGIAPDHPEPLPYRYSVRDALPHVVKVGKIRESGYMPAKTSSEPSPTLMAGGGHGMNTSQFGVEVVAGDGPSIAGYAIEREYDKLNPGQGSDKYLNLIRADAGEPCPTVTATGGSSPGTAGVVHPTEKRKFTIAELKRIGSFPDDFKLSGSYAQQWERIGRAVPPVMMSHIARTVAGILRRAQSRIPARPPGSRDRSTKG